MVSCSPSPSRTRSRSTAPTSGSPPSSASPCSPLLYFSQARELKRLREWAGRAPERARELEQRVVAQATATVARRARGARGTRQARGRDRARRGAWPRCPRRAARRGQQRRRGRRAGATQVADAAEATRDQRQRPGAPAARGAGAAATPERERDGRRGGRRRERRRAASRPPATRRPRTSSRRRRPPSLDAADAGRRDAARPRPAGSRGGAGDRGEHALAEGEHDGETGEHELGETGEHDLERDRRPRGARRDGRARRARRARRRRPRRRRPAHDARAARRRDAQPRAAPAAPVPADGHARRRGRPATPARRAGPRRPRRRPEQSRSAGTIALLVGPRRAAPRRRRVRRSPRSSAATIRRRRRTRRRRRRARRRGQRRRDRTPSMPHEETTVGVLNGTTTNGLAGTIADQLAQEGGYERGITATNTRDQTLQASTVYYGHGFRAQARDVAELLGDRHRRAGGRGDRGARPGCRRHRPRRAPTRPASVASGVVSLFARVGVRRSSSSRRSRPSSSPSGSRAPRRSRASPSSRGSSRPTATAAATVARFRLKVAQADDMTATIVDAGGNDGPADRRPASRSARDVPLTLEWDGATDADGDRARTGATPRARQPPPRRPRRHARARARGRHARAAPDRDRRRAGRARWITGPVAGDVPLPRARRLRTPTRRSVQVLRTDRAAPTVVARFDVPSRACATAAGTASRTARRRRPGTYQIVASVRDHAGNVGRSAPPADERRRARARAAGRERAPADRAAAGRPGARGPQRAVRRRLARAAVPWSVRRIGERKPRSSGEARGRRRAAGSRRPTGLLGPLRVLNVSDRPEPHDASRSRCRTRSRADPRRPPGAHVVRRRTGSTTTATACPTRSSAASPVAYPKLMQDGLPGRLHGRHGGAARLPRRPEDPLRHHDGPDARRDPRPGSPTSATGVLLAGPLRWIPTELARRLRRYVSGGGRVAMFGADTLRRGVDVGRDRLLRPLPPTPLDPFGAALRRVRACGTPQPLEPIADEGGTGLLTGVDTLPGFTRGGGVGPVATGCDVGARAGRRAGARGGRVGAARTPPETLPALALTRVGDGHGDPRRAAGVGRAPPGPRRARAAAHPQHRRHPARRASRRSAPSRCAVLAADTAAAPGGLRVLGIIVAAVLRRDRDPRPRRRARARGRCSARSRSRRCCWCSSIWYTPQLAHVREHPLIALGAGLVVAAIVVVPLAVLFDRRRGLAPARGARRAAVPRPGRGRRPDGEPARPALPRDRRGRAGVGGAAGARPGGASTRRPPTARLEIAARRLGRALRAPVGLLARRSTSRSSRPSSSTCRSRCCSSCCATSSGRRGGCRRR